MRVFGTERCRARAVHWAFWHIVTFAWIANLGMHIGLTDMAMLRYAKNSWYGFYSAFGMYLGHYVAWIGAGRNGRCGG